MDVRFLRDRLPTHAPERHELDALLDEVRSRLPPLDERRLIWFSLRAGSDQRTRAVHCDGRRFTTRIDTGAYRGY